jgi:hypothetical protein
MKVLLSILIFFMFSTISYAQTWIRAGDTITLYWNAVPKVQPTDAIKYQPYVKYNSPTATPQPIQGEIETTTKVIQFSNDAKCYLCVETVRYPEGETIPIKSNRLACTDVGGDTASGSPFGVSYFVAPGVSSGMRLVP